ncbi:MAG: PEGA domain-containing protein [Candidatus Berkelbacteria bacterium]|nr:PEGA domain-containing protein [Candidatus Berkelbacteria bacterium]
MADETNPNPSSDGTVPIAEIKDDKPATSRPARRAEPSPLGGADQPPVTSEPLEPPWETPQTSRQPSAVSRQPSAIGSQSATQSPAPSQPAPASPQPTSRPVTIPPPPPPPPRPPQAPKPPIGTRAMIQRKGPGRISKIILCVVAFLIIAGGVFYFFFYRVTFVINPTPAPDKITLDGKQVKNGTYRVTPGTHSVEIEKKGFVSYRENKDFSIGEKQNLNFAFEKAESAETIADGAIDASASYDLKFINFISKSGNLSAVSTSKQNNAWAQTQLSNGAYTNVRKVLFSNDEKFAVLLDNEALRVIDFAKSDLLNQVEAKLPPLASTIHSIALNTLKSQYFPEVNSKIIYDMEVPYGWSIIMANRDHSQSEIIMQLDKKDFSSLYLDWNDSAKDLLVVGGQVGIFDLSSRDYKTISKDADFVWGKWGQSGKNAALVDTDGNVWALSNGKVTKINLKTKPGLISFISQNEAIIAVDGRPVKFNFDSKEIINYAEINGLDGATSMAAISSEVYFSDQDGLKTAPIQEIKYVK